MSILVSKSASRRSDILNNLADHVLAHGLIASSLRALAKAAGTSDRMLLYYFKDKSEIIAATIEVVAARMVLHMNDMASPQPLPLDALVRHLAGVLSDPQFRPYMRLWLEIAGMAARDDPFYAQVGEVIGRGFLSWGAAQIADAGDGYHTRDAAKLLIMMEGIVFLNSIGLKDVVQTAIGIGPDPS
jgi:AcrR family transcriptional regulator